MTEPKDAAPFDSVPGIGFDSDRAAAAIVPPPGRISGTGSALLVDPAQNNAFRAVNRAWKQGAVRQPGQPGRRARDTPSPGCRNRRRQIS